MNKELTILERNTLRDYLFTWK